MESPESWFHNRATLYVEAQILFHLNQAGVWGLLKQGGAHTAPEIAGSLRLDPAATDALLDYVFQVDRLLSATSGRPTRSPSSAARSGRQRRRRRRPTCSTSASAPTGRSGRTSAAC